MATAELEIWNKRKTSNFVQLMCAFSMRSKYIKWFIMQIIFLHVEANKKGNLIVEKLNLDVNIL